MDNTFWHKQTPEQPLFPNLLWSRPEMQSAAGKLLIVGGNAYAFAAPAEAYAAAERAGVGLSRVLLPQRVKREVGNLLTTVEYAMSNPSGGFSQLALGDLLDLANWADGVLLAGDFGRNSETAILLEKFLAAHNGQVTLTKDTVDYFTPNPTPLLQRLDTTVVLSFAQLQKLAGNAHFSRPFTFDMDVLRLVETLHDFTLFTNLNVITKHLDYLFVAVRGQISSTKVVEDPKIWRVTTAASASVWWLQNPSKPFEALSTACATIYSK